MLNFEQHDNRNKAEINGKMKHYGRMKRNRIASQATGSDGVWLGCDSGAQQCECNTYKPFSEFEAACNGVQPLSSWQLTSNQPCSNTFLK